MPTCDDATLANLELPGIDHGECMFAFIHDRPSFFAPCHPLAKVARISYGEFDQLPSPIQSAGRRKNDCSVRCGSKAVVRDAVTAAAPIRLLADAATTANDQESNVLNRQINALRAVPKNAPENSRQKKAPRFP
jgi:hypothetical protein